MSDFPSYDALDDVTRRSVDNYLTWWKAYKEESAAAVERERQWRDYITKLLFPTKRKGTNRYQLPRGYSVKLVAGIAYTLGLKDKPLSKADQVEAVQKACDQLGIEGIELANKLIDWEPKLVVKEYEALDTNNPVHRAVKAMFDAILTTKDAMPQLELETPKEPGK